MIGNTIFSPMPEGREQSFRPDLSASYGPGFLPSILMIMLAWGAIWWFTDRGITQWINSSAPHSRPHIARPSFTPLPPRLASAAEFKLMGMR